MKAVSLVETGLFRRRSGGELHENRWFVEATDFKAGAFAGGFFGPAAAEMGYTFYMRFSNEDNVVAPADMATTCINGVTVGLGTECRHERSAFPEAACTPPAQDQERALSASDGNFGARSAPGLLGIGAAWGLLATLPAIAAAMLSGGAGHGDYIAARILFPFSILLTLVEGSIGIVGITIAVLQFPLYGAVLNWSLAREQFRPLIALAAVHFIAAMICFSGIVPDFS